MYAGVRVEQQQHVYDQSEDFVKPRHTLFTLLGMRCCRRLNRRVSNETEPIRPVTLAWTVTLFHRSNESRGALSSSPSTEVRIRERQMVPRIGHPGAVAQCVPFQ